jgi:hypothetical protein
MVITAYTIIADLITTYDRLVKQKINQDTTKDPLAPEAVAKEIHEEITAKDGYFHGVCDNGIKWAEKQQLTGDAVSAADLRNNMSTYCNTLYLAEHVVIEWVGRTWILAKYPPRFNRELSDAFDKLGLAVGSSYYVQRTSVAVRDPPTSANAFEIIRPLLVSPKPAAGVVKPPVLRGCHIIFFRFLSSHMVILYL